MGKRSRNKRQAKDWRSEAETHAKQQEFGDHDRSRFMQQTDHNNAMDRLTKARDDIRASERASTPSEIANMSLEDYARLNRMTRSRYSTTPDPWDLVRVLVADGRKQKLTQMQEDIEDAVLVFSKLQAQHPHVRPLHAFEMAANKLKKANERYDDYRRAISATDPLYDPRYDTYNPHWDPNFKRKVSKDKPQLTPLGAAGQAGYAPGLSILR